MKPRVLLGIAVAIGAASTVLAACNQSPKAEEFVYRKAINNIVEPNKYSVWVTKDINDTENIIVYEVPKDYYESLSPGDKFDSKYAIGEGVTEMQIVDGIG